MKRIIPITSLFFISLGIDAQVNWGITGGPIQSEVNYYYVSGNPNSRVAKLEKSFGYQGGLFFNKQIKSLKIGVETILLTNSFRYIEYPEEGNCIMVYTTIKCPIGFSPIDGFWIEIAPAIYLPIKDSFVSGDWAKKRPNHFASTFRVAYQYNRYSLGLGYTNCFSPFGSIDTGSSVWEFKYSHIELSLSIRLGTFKFLINPKIFNYEKRSN